MEEISFVGIRLIITLALVGGLIAYIADVLGKRIGKAHIRIFGLRPRQNARIMTVMSGVIISVLSITVVALTSESARVALFGMEKLTTEIQSLEQERDRVVLALREAKANVQSQNAVIADLDSKIQKANANVDEAAKKVAELNEAKAKLAGEVTKLETNTKILKDGITAMREGELFYHAGEVVYAGVMRGNLSHEENIVQLNWLLRTANKTVLSRLGMINQNVEQQQEPQAIVLQEQTINRALKELDKAKNDKFFRVRTLTNVIVGEVTPCNIDFFDNVLIYSDGDTIYHEEYTMPKGSKNEDVIMGFLAKVNRASVDRGVVADPITGNVGGMGAEGVLKVSNQLHKAGKHFVVEAKADGDIYTSGPVRLTFNVAKVVDD